MSGFLLGERHKDSGRRVILGMKWGHPPCRPTQQLFEDDLVYVGVE